MNHNQRLSDSRTVVPTSTHHYRQHFRHRPTEKSTYALFSIWFRSFGILQSSRPTPATCHQDFAAYRNRRPCTAARGNLPNNRAPGRKRRQSAVLTRIPQEHSQRAPSGADRWFGRSPQASARRTSADAPARLVDLGCRHPVRPLQRWSKQPHNGRQITSV